MMLRTSFSSMKIVTTFLLVIVSCITLSESIVYRTCPGRTLISNVTSGQISIIKSGSIYDKEINCVWMIEATNESFITLDVSQFDTCSLDVLYIYEGCDGSQKRRLGALSGSLRSLGERTFIASHCMLVQFVTYRTATNRQGFELNFSIGSCPANCVGGNCNGTSGTCKCSTERRGSQCQYLVSESCLNRTNRWLNGQCQCANGWAGFNCSLAVAPGAGTSPPGVWHSLTTSESQRIFTPRAYAASVATSSALYVFGGRDERQSFSDFLRLPLPQADNWSRVVSASGPDPRHGHAMWENSGSLYMFGGMDRATGRVLAELWRWRESDGWVQLTLPSNVPSLVFHTVTKINDEVLVVGGRTESGRVSTLLYRLYVSPSVVWQLIRPRYGQAPRVFGHSTIYHPSRGALIVYGGVQENGARTGALHSFSIRNLVWTRLEGADGEKRAFHSATKVGEMMVVAAGSVEGSDGCQVNANASVLYFYLACHEWKDEAQMRAAGGLSATATGDVPPPRFGHNAVLLRGHILLLLGGYAGKSLDQLDAYVLPNVVARPTDSSISLAAHCAGLRICTADPSCAVCYNGHGEQCVPVNSTLATSRNSSSTCNFMTCAGLCRHLPSCVDCLAYENVVGDPYVQPCAWCSHEAKCVTDERLRKGSSVSPCPPTSSSLHWWSSTQTITTVAQCMTAEPPAGVFLAYMFPPMNYSLPDKMILVSSLEAVYLPFIKPWPLTSVSDPLKDTAGASFGFEVMGAVSPLISANYISQSGVKYPFLMNKHGYQPNVNMYLSTDETVARLRPLLPKTGLTVTHTMQRLFGISSPFVNVAAFYLMRILFTRPYSSHDEAIMTRVELKWTSVSEPPINGSYLKPGQDSSQCSSLTNCLSCAANAACGWCRSASVCQTKTGGAHCVSPIEEVIISVGQCPNCTQYDHCDECTMDPICEWYPPALACIRRGRFNSSLTDTSACPLTCVNRTSCTSCLGDSSCIWCDTSSSCQSKTSLQWNLFSDCPVWRDTSPCASTCLSSSCGSCNGQQGCGWCHNTSTAHLGSCVRWRNSPLLPLHSASTECTVNGSELAYYQCPPVDECALELDDKCQANSTCVDLRDGYRCECNPGFKGNGEVKCERTCYPACANGRCSEAPHYTCICDLGMTGEDCATDCGCNRHSNCSTGVGVCDACQHGTTGASCDRCLDGHFGNASLVSGCSPCNCNGHGKLPHLCDPDTGVCDCQGNTQGTSCSQCLPGHHGDPTVASHPCYATCEGRRLLSNFTANQTYYVGWRQGASASTEAIRHCHWLVDARQNSSQPPLIVVQFLVLNNLPCNYGGIYFHNTFANVSQSLPTNSAEELQVGLIDVVCDRRLYTSIESNTGILGFYFIHELGTKYPEFAFTISLLTCPDCGLNRTCRDGRCQCPIGRRGALCELFVCPANCSDGNGVCENGACRCHSTWTGEDCSRRVDNVTGPIVSLLTDETPARFGHSLVTCGGKILLFGGESRLGSPSSLLYQYSERWQLISCTGLCPPAMAWHAAVCDEQVSKPAMLILGPSDGAIWRYEVSASTWTRIPLVGALAGGAQGHTLTLTNSKDKIVMIGGLIRASNSVPWTWNEQILIFNISGAVFTLKPTGQLPAGIYGHTAATGADTPDLIFAIGGFHSIRYTLLEVSLKKASSEIIPAVTSDIYALHISTGKWFLMSSPRVLGTTPPAHAYAAIVKVGHSQVLVHGGIGADGNPLSDKVLRVYDLFCNVWSEANIDWRDTNAYTRNFSMTYGSRMTLLKTGQFLLVGGALAGTVSSLTLSVEQLSGAGGLSLRCQTCQCAPAEAQAQQCDLQPSCRHCRAASLDPEQSVGGARFGVRPRTCVWCGNCDITRPCRNATSCGHTCTFTIQGYGAPCSGEESCGDYASCSTCKEKWPFCEWSRTKDRCEYVNTSPDPKHSGMTKPSCLAEGCVPTLGCKNCLQESALCAFSEGRRSCIKQTIIPLDCAGGRCGGVFRRSCLQLNNCTAQTICSRCLATPACGWVATNPGSLDGQGTCTIGGFAGPQQCSADTGACSQPELHWAYAQCPPENECINGHHTCDEIVEVCVDKMQGFRCDCKPGYERQAGKCKPKCDSCVKGTCIRPNVCECNFGYVGAACNVKCECNGLSNCRGPDRDERKECLNCTQNTMGAQCQYCKPNFVGDPTNQVTCQSCNIYCHGHTSKCSIRPNLPGGSNADRGPTAAEAICTGCANFTEGDTCGICQNGYFRLSELKTSPCQICQCNGHNSMCDKDTGSGCNCRNNTRSEDNCDKPSEVKKSKTLMKTCYRIQCASCDEYYLGKPINGRHCYRRVPTEQPLCLDYYHNMAQCGLQPQKPLPFGKTVLFSIQPRFMNVDIRVIIEMEKGEVDIYLTFDHQRFVIRNDPVTWNHNVTVEPPSTTSSISGATLTRRRRSASSDIKDEKVTEFIKTIAVSPDAGVLILRKVSQRVVFYVSHKIHNLKTRRFFFIFQAVSKEGAVGRLSFKQLQAHIDLFVFFSVFFACFFLMLGAFIVGWKCKQVMDYRRSIEEEAKARQTMASRPFARVYVALDRRQVQKPEDDFQDCVRLPPLTDSGRIGGKSAGSEFSPVPVAVEPTDDGIACVGTLIIQMPGPVLALGSGLMTMRVMYPTGAGKQAGPGGGMRRRASVSAC